MSRTRTMLSQTGRKVLAITFAGVLTTWSLPAKQTDALSTQTMKNLNAALNGERNAHTRYLAFAQKADEEGYGAVGSLFRAAAAAEEVHGNNHEETIRRLGGAPDVKMEAPAVRSTPENLQAAISGETYEKQTMYPEFIAQARQDRTISAVVTFERAIRAEAEHARLFEDALQNLDKLRGSTTRTYYVCTVCGFTTTELNFSKCPSCFRPKDRYKAIN